ncbi:MAG: methyltransferase [Thermoplasmatota archaeon]
MDRMEYHFAELGIRYRETEGVYPVREDTLLLLETVFRSLRRPSGRVMEMGCGTGLLSLALSRKGWKATAVDREPRALLNLRHNLTRNDLSADLYLSDLFEGIPRRLQNTYDLICFNPPYLKSAGGGNGRREELALSGGNSGCDTALRFISDGYYFLAPGGKMILLASSTWPDKWDIHCPSIFGSRRVLERSEIEGERFEVIEYTGIS